MRLALLVREQALACPSNGPGNRNLWKASFYFIYSIELPDVSRFTIPQRFWWTDGAKRQAMEAMLATTITL